MPRTTVYLVRHGARHDYANPSLWKSNCERLGHELSDPPLSALGHQQAREVAAALKGEKIDAILSSPYLRVLQTAQPLAHALGLPLHVENSLSEFHHKPAKIPLPGTRMAVLPEVDDSYAPILAQHRVDAKGSEPVVEYLRRLMLLADEIPKRHAGRTIACFSHAASVGLVAAMTGCAQLTAAGTFAPAGIYKLVSDDGGATWIVERRGDDNTGHVSSNDPSTYAWGFEHASRVKDAYQSVWEEAQRLGPTPLSEASAPARSMAATPAEPAPAAAGGGQLSTGALVLQPIAWLFVALAAVVAGMRESPDLRVGFVKDALALPIFAAGACTVLALPHWPPPRWLLLSMSAVGLVYDGAFTANSQWHCTEVVAPEARTPMALLLTLAAVVLVAGPSVVWQQRRVRA